MSWPQWTIIAAQVVGILVIIVSNVKNTRISSERATASILFWIAYTALYDAVLHAGGFW